MLIRYLHRNIERHPGRCLMIVSAMLLVMAVPCAINAAGQWLYDRKSS